MVYCVQPLMENHEVLTAHVCVTRYTTRSRFKRAISFLMRKYTLSLHDILLILIYVIDFGLRDHIISTLLPLYLF